MSRDCEHGRLARSCHECEMEARIRELEDGIRQDGHRDTCGYVLSEPEGQYPCECAMRLLPDTDTEVR